jgi:hypothetical protein
MEHDETLWGMHRIPDAPTSIDAAKTATVRAETHRALALRLIRTAPNGLTDFELADLTRLQQNSIGKRRTELLQRGLVRDSGERRPSWTGCRAIVWVAVDPPPHPPLDAP